MGNVVRIGDKVGPLPKDPIPCGDNSAQGSSNVFANGMPITHEGKKATTGHGCFPPTVFVGPWTSTVFVNNKGVALKDKTEIKRHRCGKRSHGGIAVTGAATVSFEE